MIATGAGMLYEHSNYQNNPRQVAEGPVVPTKLNTICCLNEHASFQADKSEQQKVQDEFDKVLSNVQEINASSKNLQAQWECDEPNALIPCEYFNDRNTQKPNTSFNQYRRKIWSAKRADENSASMSAVSISDPSRSKAFPSKKSMPFDCDYLKSKKSLQKGPKDS